MQTRSGRSLARIDRNDLLRLAALAAEVEAGLFARDPQGPGRYAGRLVCRALCPGAALHYVDAANGVKDFDVWSSMPSAPTGRSRTGGGARRIKVPPKFGRYPGAPHCSPAVAWTCSGARWRCRLAPTRPRSCTTTLLQHAPPPRKRWRPRQSCSSIPSSWPGKSPGSRALHAGTMCAVTNRGRISCSACHGGGGSRARRAANLRTVTGMLVC